MTHLKRIWLCVLANTTSVITTTRTRFVLELADSPIDFTSDYQRFEDGIISRDWHIVPMYPGLVEDVEIEKLNINQEIPLCADVRGRGNIEDPMLEFNSNDKALMKKHNLHRMFWLDIPGENISLEHVEDTILPNPAIAYILMAPAISLQSYPDDMILDINDNLRGGSTSHDYSDCSQFPCQAYLYHNESPNEYLMVGNNIYRVWNEFKVKGKGTRIVVMEAGVVNMTDQTEIKVKRTVMGKDSSPTPRAHKTSVAGIIAAQHNHRSVEGIAPDIDLLIDYPVTNNLFVDEELIRFLKAGDIINASMSTSLTRSKFEEMLLYDEIVYEPGVPIIFNPTMNKMFNMLSEKGVAIITALPSGGANYNTDFWKKNYPVSRRGKQTAAVIASWDPLTGQPRENGSYVSKWDAAFIDIQLGNWGAHVVTIDPEKTGGVNTQFTGTSPATSITSAVALLVQSAAKQYLNKYLTPKKLIQTLQDTGAELFSGTQPYKDFGHNCSMPDAYLAVVKVLEPLCKNPVKPNDVAMCSAIGLSNTTAKGTTTKKKTTQRKSTTGKGTTKAKTTTKKQTTTKVTNSGTTKKTQTKRSGH